MRLTKHGRKRLRGRLGLSGGAPERMAARALERGIPLEETSGLLRDFLASRVATYPGAARTAIVYGEAVFLFGHDQALITVMHLPRGLRPIARQLAERRKGAA